MRKLFIILILFSLHLHAQLRASSAPFISGDTFRSFADFIFDETGNTVEIEKVTPGSIIFVKTDLLPLFFQSVHPSIPHPYVLVSHNADSPVGKPFLSKLEDEKIIAWFAQNVEGIAHPKLHPIPIGLANRYWSHGDIGIFAMKQREMQNFGKSNLLYMNISVWTCSYERAPVYNRFSKMPFCLTYQPNRGLPDYLEDLIRSKFVISPRGNGLDCHRTWEALYMGAIPIVRSSTLDPLYENLPVLIIQNWEEVTEDFLLEQYDVIKNRSWDPEKLTANYWGTLIRSYRGSF